MPVLNIPEATYQRLAAKAAALNVSVEELVVPALDQLAAGPPTGPTAVPSIEERQRAFAELTRLIESRADRYPPGHIVDDDRESIYREREDAQL